jgi:hypothetical protein
MSTTPEHLTAATLAALIREAIAGETPVELAEGREVNHNTTGPVYLSIGCLIWNVLCLYGSPRRTNWVCNDATAEMWTNEGGDMDPLDLLTTNEWSTFRKRIQEAKPATWNAKGKVTP